MIIDTFVYLKNKEMTTSPVPERNMGSDFKIKLVVIVGGTLILISSLIISVCAVLQLKQIQEEVANLRWEIEQLKLGGVVDSELLNDLRRFEIEEIYQENNINSIVPDDHHTIDDGLLESDYDVDYENVALLDSDEEDPSPTDISVFISKKKNNVANLKDEARAKRDTTANSPIISELYNAMARKSETADGKKQIRELWMQATDGNFNSTPNVLLSNKNMSDSQPKRNSRKRRSKATTKLHQWEPIGEDTTAEDSPEPRRRNRHRQKNNIEIFDEKPRTVHFRPSPVIQLVGDTSKYVMGQHTNYNGNGHLRHLHSTYVDWIANDWVQSTNMDKYFEVDSGTIKVKESGIYFVYAQIFYLDEHDTNGYRIYRNKEIFLQCTTMTHSLERVIKSNTCYTGGLSILNEGDEVYVQDLGTGRYSIFEPGKSFFGLIKVADVKVK